MSDVLEEVLATNANYASRFGAEGKLALLPERRFAC